MKKKSLLALLLVAILLPVMFCACAPQEDDPWTNSDGTPIVCRRNGCGQKPVYPEWNRRYCSEHIQDHHYCRHPDCHNEIPNVLDEVYCEEHRE